MDIFVIAGAVSTTLFALANLPMVVRAARTKNLDSYSLPSLAIGNVANAVHTVYVVNLPFGPIWVLHGFYLVTMGWMLALYLRYTAGRREGGAPRSTRPPRDVAQENGPSHAPSSTL